MNSKFVKDVMLPLDEYAVVSTDTKLSEALQALDKAQLNLPPGSEPHRAILVSDDKGKIVGKLGHLAFLKALEPKYNVFGDLDKLSRAGVNEDFINSMMDNFRFWGEDLSVFCRRAHSIKVGKVMKPIAESIDENATLTEALHRIVMWQTLSILVTRGKRVVGILRLSDLFRVITDYIKTEDCNQ